MTPPGQTTSAVRPVIYSHTALRGLAALYVVFFHMLLDDTGKLDATSRFQQFFESGPYAVDLFFILSGFILHWVYVSEEAPLRWGSYFRARAARILPLYYLTTLLLLPVMLYSALKYGSTYVGEAFNLKVALNALVLSGVVFGNKGTFNTPAWSVSVEFFCYLTVFPLLVWAARRLYAKAYRAVLWLFLAGVCLHFLVWYQAAPLALGSWQWNSAFLVRGIFGFALGFALGALYQQSAQARPGPGAANLVWTLFAGLFLMAGAGLLPGGVLLYSLPFVVYSSATDAGPVARLLKTPPLQWLGERSYSIYLWHAIILGSYTRYLRRQLPACLYFTLALVLILVVANLSYRYFECPCRNLLRRRHKKSSPSPEPLMQEGVLHGTGQPRAERD